MGEELIPFFNDAELTLITIDLLILSFAYGWLFPRLRAFDLRSLSRYDIITSLTAVGIAGMLFYGHDTSFRFLGLRADWFWFAFGWYLILEIPFAFAYMKKHGMFTKD